MAPKTRALETKVPESEITDVDVVKLERDFPGFHFRKPVKGESYLTFKEKELCIFLRHLKDGLDLPLPGFIQLVLQYFQMVPAQLTPNSIANLHGLFRFFSQWNIEWTIPNVMSLVTFSAKGGGLYFVKARHSTGLSMSGTPAAIHKWKSKYVFVESRDGWRINPIPKEVDMAAFRNFEPSAAIIALYQNMDCAHFDLNVKTLAVDTSGMSKADQAKEVKLGAAKEKKRGRKKVEKVKVVEEEDDEEEEEEEEVTPVKRRKMPLRKSRKSKKLIEDSEENEEAEIEESEDVSLENTTEEQVASREGAEARAEDDNSETSTSEDVSLSEEAEGQGTEGGSSKSPRCWWDDSKGTFTFRYNREIPMVPQVNLNDVPAQIIVPFMTKEDKDYLESLSESNLVRLQSHLSFGGAIVTRYMFELFGRKDLKLEKEKKMKEKMVEEKKLSDGDLEKARDAMLNQETAHLAEVKDLKEEILKLREEKDAAVQEKELTASKLKILEAQLKKEREIAQRSKDEHHKHILELKAEVDALKIAGPSSSMTEEEAKAVYENSEAYKEAMGDFGEYGFDLLKAVLIKDNLLDQAAADALDYVDCMMRAAGKQL